MAHAAAGAWYRIPAFTHGQFAYPPIRRLPWPPVRPPIKAQPSTSLHGVRPRAPTSGVRFESRTRMAFVIHIHVTMAAGLSAKLDFDISRCRYEDGRGYHRYPEKQPPTP